MHTRSITAALLAIGATALLLTGCAQQPTDETTKKPASSATAPDGYEKPAYENACDGKQAVISGDGETHKLAKGCDAVSITSSGSKVTTGATKSVMVEGSNNDITLDSADTITLLGTNNTVHVKNGSPEVDDQGTGNTVN
ncbi:DUF3060 domain-containing protein [Curtobacterium sp. RRHDQ66]|uniref:DUF3060 domain-containing protein n=1 Tax=Curtobacterium guangdongense TaxID=3413380 RepID=UPI003BF0213C